MKTPEDLRKYLAHPPDLSTPAGLEQLRRAFFSAFHLDETCTKRDLLFRCLLEMSGRSPDLTQFVTDAMLLAELVIPEDPPPSPYEALVTDLSRDAAEVYLAAPPLLPSIRVADAVNAHQLVPWILMGAYTYGHHGISIIPDEDFDAMCQWLHADYDLVEHPHRSLIRREALPTSSFRYLSAQDYPTIVKVTALTRWACMERLNLPFLDAGVAMHKLPARAANATFRMDLATALKKMSEESSLCM